MSVTTRARAVTVRLAEPHEGPLIETLWRASGNTPPAGLDWSRPVTPYWLIAEHDGAPIGCLQVCLGKPIARMEALCLDRRLSAFQQARAMKLLMETGLESCRQAGAQFVAGTIDLHQPGFERSMQRRGGVPWNEGRVYIIRVV